MPSIDFTLLRKHALIGGNWCDAATGATFAVTNPATNRVIAHVPDMNGDDALRAVECAHAAMQRNHPWQAATADQRARWLRAISNELLAHQSELAALMTAEQGKPLVEATSEVAYSAGFFQWFSEEARRIEGDVISSPKPEQRILVLKQPVGVVAIITPWNFPLAMIARKLAAALAAGCSVVIKPAAETPLTALALGELIQRCGVPAGAVNILTTSQPAPVGDVFTRHPAVRKLSFTGSTAVGKRLMAQCAEGVKRITLELGGNAPFIVFEDADIPAAVQAAVASRFRNSGQTCVCANRLLVHTAVYDTFVQQLAAAVSSLVVGPGDNPATQQGPLISDAAVLKVQRLIANALELGAQCAVGGRRHALARTFFEPTVLANVTTEMQIAHEEIFGPVATVFRFETEQQAIRLANDTPYGLAAYFFASDLARVWRVAEQLEFGMVGVNTGMISTEVAPFGGIKESGFGREGSRYGIDDYLNIKYIAIDGIGERESYTDSEVS